MSPLSLLRPSSLWRSAPLLALSLLLSLSAPAHAATLTVTSLNDTGAGSGNAGDLRYCIATANTDGGDDTITFAVTGTITVGSTLTISAPMSLAGPGAGSLAVDGGNTGGASNPNGVQVFSVSGGTAAHPVALSGLTIQNGGAGVSNGGGVYNDGGTVTLTACTLTDNSGEFGGGVYNDGGTVTLTGCTLVGNSAQYGIGGAVYNEGFYGTATATLTGCTLTGNSAPIDGGLFSHANGRTTTVTLTDDIFSGDTGGEVENSGGGTATASHCDIGEALGAGGDGVTDGGHNINADPRFVSGTNLHLQATSPCIGQGISVPGVTYDVTGTPYFAPPAIGAYEYVSQTLLVTNAGASGNGSLADAVTQADATPHTLIIFDPAAFAAKQTITPGVTLDITASTAILGPPAGVAIDGDHAVGVMEVDGGGLSAVGLTLQNGNDNGGGGGGLSNNSSHDTATVTLTDCTLADNSGGNGAGLANDSNHGTATVTLTACTLIGNSTQTGNGGAVYNVGFYGTATTTLSGCTLVGNSVQNGHGGAVYNQGYGGTATVTLTGSTLVGNSGADGGAIYNDGYNGTATATLTDDILYGDTGGEIYNDRGTLTATYDDIQGGIDGNDAANHIINTDPQFLNAPGDLRPAVGSPVTGAGTPLPGNQYDADGRLRPTPPAIGAYEPAAGTLTATGRSFSAGAGVPLGVYVATFTDGNASPTFPHVTINWGDGTAPDTTTGAVYRSGFAPNGYAVYATHTYATAGQQYTVTVSTEDSAAYAAVATATATVVTAPAAPTTLTATAAHSQTVLTWNASATPGVTYSVFRGTTPGGEAATPLYSGTSRTFTDPSPVYGQPNYYIVKAVKAGVASLPSPEATATASQVVPGAPTSLSATPSNGIITLKWTAPAGPVTGYNVYRGTTAGGENFSSPVYSGAARSFTDITVSNGLAYFYVVTAVNATGEGPASNEVSAKPVAPPAAPTLTPTRGKTGSGKITLSWGAATGATLYTLTRSVHSDGSAPTTLYAYGKPGSFTDSGLTSGSPFYYQVIASNAGGQTPSALVPVTAP